MRGINNTVLLTVNLSDKLKINISNFQRYLFGFTATRFQVGTQFHLSQSYITSKMYINMFYFKTNKLHLHEIEEPTTNNNGSKGGVRGCKIIVDLFSHFPL